MGSTPGHPKKCGPYFNNCRFVLKGQMVDLNARLSSEDRTNCTGVVVEKISDNKQIVCAQF